jgi:hypothetical protein
MLFNPSHPGEVLKDYLGDMTVKEAARRLGVTRPNLSRMSRLSWKWRERSSVKIAERTYEKRAQALHC